MTKAPSCPSCQRCIRQSRKTSYRPIASVAGGRSPISYAPHNKSDEGASNAASESNFECFDPAVLGEPAVDPCWSTVVRGGETVHNDEQVEAFCHEPECHHKGEDGAEGHSSRPTSFLVMMEYRPRYRGGKTKPSAPHDGRVGEHQKRGIRLTTVLTKVVKITENSEQCEGWRLSSFPQRWPVLIAADLSRVHHLLTEPACVSSHLSKI
jgi:hypothetical protein